MNMKPCVDITQPSRQDSVESAIRTIHRNSAQVFAQQGLAGKQLELLIIILPDVSGSYGKLVKNILKLMSDDFNFLVLIASS
jgi:eukaryotic translation initiation factor 2C